MITYYVQYTCINIEVARRRVGPLRYLTFPVPNSSFFKFPIWIRIFKQNKM